MHVPLVGQIRRHAWSVQARPRGAAGFHPRMTTTRLAELEKAIERNDVRAVVYHLRGATESERRAANPQVMALAKRNWDFKGLRAAAAVAALGTAAGTRQVAEVLRSVTLGDSVPQAVQVLEERRPKWLDDLPKALLVGESAMPRSWRLVRAL